MKNTLKLNHENRTIVMDRTFAKRSENTRSEEYAHLQQVRQDYPTYTVIRRQIKTNPKKESYKGLTYEYMQEFKNLGFSNQLFPFPKSSALMKHIVYLANCNDGIVLDFFSGSGTMAQGVMKLNAEDGGNRKFIMVQLPEICDEDSDAKKAGFDTICDIGKERIRRAGKKIVEDNPLTTQNLDTGFRVFKLDESNMNNVYYSADEYSQDLLLEIGIDGTKEDFDRLLGYIAEAESHARCSWVDCEADADDLAEYYDVVLRASRGEARSCE